MSSLTGAMCRIYYVTMMIGLLAGVVFFAKTFRIGWAEDLFLPENEIAIPADFPSDAPVYDPTKITVTLYGFDYSVGPKAQRLTYRLNPGVTFNTVTTYYRQELKSNGWTTGESQPGQGPAGTALVEFSTFTSEKADAKLLTHISTQKDGITVRIEYTPRNMKAAAYDAEGTEIPDDFPSFFSLHPAAGLFSYEVRADAGGNRYSAYFQIPGSETSIADLKDFYTEWVVDEGWEKTKESSIGKEYLAFSDGVRRLEIVIQPVTNAGSGQEGSPAYYQVSMQAVPLRSIALTEQVEEDEPSLSQTLKGSTLAFPDVPNGYGYAEAIGDLREAGVLQGYADGTFKPGATVNRAEFLKTVLQATGVEMVGSTCFPDVKAEWFAPAVCKAREEGIVSGYEDGKFHPERNVSRAEAVKIVLRTFDLLPNELMEGWDWYDKYFHVAQGGGYLAGMGSFHEQPRKKLTRGEMAQLIANVAGR